MSLRSIQKAIQSYGNINKITSSLKLVSAAKMAKTERLLKDVRPFGHGTLSFYKKYTHINMLDHIQNHLIFAITSDRGLCGGLHTAVVKKVKQELNRPDQQFAKVVCVGQKSEELLAKSYKSNILFTVFKIGKDNPTFLEASKIFNEYNYAEFIACQMFYNRIVTKGTSQVDWISIYNTDFLLSVAHIASLEEIEEETMKSYIEFSTVSLLFFAMMDQKRHFDNCLVSYYLQNIQLHFKVFRNQLHHYFNISPIIIWDIPFDVHSLLQITLTFLKIILLPQSKL
ncbi:PREDICTED: ATP synthase subunit gamma, mitochondrial-like [Diuraphis noxia]|uniref:ATP synthase subunit gamma, mitochondrial-like n=1 Tax=Diuraphis noxia TaxID=143948 RepID=UPI0007639887|nr:PREDICTED: ATP synthase subunit gamma, mitochondrial-like [Diuraphis noxia]